MPVLTLLDIAKRQGHDQVVGLIEANLNAYPEMGRFPVRVIPGTNYSTLVRQDYPTSAFRGANEGTTAGVSKYLRNLVECFIIDQQLRVDSKVAQAADDGQAAVLADEAQGGFLGVARLIASQIYYGVANDPKGFPGLAAQVDPTRVYTVGASTAKSSVWAIKFGVKDVSLIAGSGDGLILDTDWRLQNVTDTNGNPYDAFINCISGWVGMQLTNPNSVGRITTLGADTDTNNTMRDSFAYSLLEQMPANYQPDLWIMNRRSVAQLRRSRITALITQPPMPTDISGVPILVTDAITNAETI